MADVGSRIREIREKRGMTQDQLADAISISKGFLSEVENNKRNVSSQILLRIAKALGASVDFLLQGKSRKANEGIPVVIPPELSKAAEDLNLSFSQTLELLDAHNSIIARRSNKQKQSFTVDDWKNLYKAIKRVYG
jgi:transcriptional regulator with XRE-family HTH domain